MEYSQAVDFIHSLANLGSKPGLSRVERLMDLLGNPERKLKFIHVAGTNGKGSTCTMLSGILTKAGYKTGLFISPFVVDFRERIQFNSQMIAQSELAEVTAQVKLCWDVMKEENNPATEFEVLTAVAMQYYLEKECDIVVLEVGLGGKLDSTNIIPPPLVSVICSLSLDHTQLLGETIEQIAEEKCGIIKQGSICVSYPRQEPAALAVIMQHCAEKENQLLVGTNAEIISMDITGSVVKYGEWELKIPLIGNHQVWNTLTVLETIRALALRGIIIPKQTVIDGIEQTKFASRLEILSHNPLVILDGAHNISGAKALASALSLLGNREIHAIVGMVRDKDVHGCLAEVLPLCKSVCAVASVNPRSHTAKEIAQLAKQFCDDVVYSDICQQGVKNVISRCGEQEVVLIFGSLYLASEVRAIVLDMFNPM